MSDWEPGQNPFAGLRPFSGDEHELFFGRDRVVDDLLVRLAGSRFLAVLGPSGSGKSSVVRAGLIPSLHGGLLRGAGSGWRTAICTPGGSPFGELARALAEQGLVPGADDSNQAAGMAEARLRRSATGLVDVVGRAGLGPRDNVLVLVDQFEELFRFAASQRDGRVDDEAAAFVQLLLGTIEADEPRLFVALTMRSDFLGDCARYRGLAEVMSRHLHLVPRMTRAERKEAIVGPVAMAEARVAPRLVSRLLNEAGDESDHLPVLQHALMRIFDVARSEGGRPAIDFGHYESVGGLEGALSEHAEEALAESTEAQQEIVERVFKTITEVGPGGRGTRRPTRLAELAAIVGAPQAEVVAAIEGFRRRDRAFLIPAAGRELTGDSVIDISHEALMRGWDRLRGWAEEEAESVKEYRRLAQAAALHPDDPQWRYLEPALTTATHWRQEHRPTEAWGVRYEPNFAAAMTFLDKSVRLKEAEDEAERGAARERLEHAERVALLQRDKTRRARRFAFVVVLLLIGSLVLALYALVAKRSADRLAEAARSAEAGALASEREAETKRGEALVASARAGEAVRALEREQAELRDAQAELQVALEDAEASGEEARLALVAAEQAAVKEAEALTAARAERVVAGFAYARSVMTRDPNAALAAAVDAAAAHDGPLDDAQRAALREILSSVRGPLLEVATGLGASARSDDGRLALATHDGVVLVDPTPGGVQRSLRGHSGRIVDVAFGRGGELATASDDGTARLWTRAGEEIAVLPHDAPVLRAVWATDGTRLATTDLAGAIQVWNRDGSLLGTPRGHDGAVHAAAFSPSSAHLLATGGDDGRACVHSGEALGDVRCLEGHSSWVRSVGFSADGTRLVTASDDGTARVWRAWNEAKPSWVVLRGHDGPILSVAISDDGARVATGSLDGTVGLWEEQPDGSWPRTRTWTGHTAWVRTVDLGSGPSAGRVVSASDDGTVRLWSMDRERESAPMILAVHPDAVRVASFSADGAYVLTSSRDGTARVLSVADDPTAALADDAALLGLACQWWAGRPVGADEYPAARSACAGVGVDL